MPRLATRSVRGDAAARDAEWSRRRRGSRRGVVAATPWLATRSGRDAAAAGDAIVSPIARVVAAQERTLRVQRMVEASTRATRSEKIDTALWALGGFARDEDDRTVVVEGERRA